MSKIATELECIQANEKPWFTAQNPLFKLHFPVSCSARKCMSIIAYNTCKLQVLNSLSELLLLVVLLFMLGHNMLHKNTYMTAYEFEFDRVGDVATEYIS